MKGTKKEKRGGKGSVRKKERVEKRGKERKGEEGERILFQSGRIRRNK